jgi:glutamine amidotransferase
MKKATVAILDYGIGNVKSISNALENIGAAPVLTSDRNAVMQADAVILPGVGAFAKGMQNLETYKLIPVIHEFVETGKPFMGICLGMQMLLEESEEFGTTKGLGLISGKVIRMPLAKDATEKLPHVTWNELKEPQPGRWAGTVLNNTPEHTSVYFVHSYVAAPSPDTTILSLTTYGDKDFCSAVHKDNIYGVQFHPEKSGEKGMAILQHFIQLI